MRNHLKNNALLPPSQVVHTVARVRHGGLRARLTTANLPPIASDPGSNAITVAVNVPN